jgi:ubiquinone biosynthesis protein
MTEPDKWAQFARMAVRLTYAVIELVRLSCIFHLVDKQEFGRRIASAAERLGPVYIKFGQFIASSPAVFGDDLASSCRPLLGTACPMPRDDVARIMDASMGKEWRDQFCHFEWTPTGAGAVAQVHKATLVDGTEVAVKISRLDAVRTIETDLKVLVTVVRSMHWFFKRRVGIDVADAVYNFCAITPGETNMTTERERIEDWRRALGQVDGVAVRVPATYRELCSPQVLTLEFVAGVAIDQAESRPSEYRMTVLRNLVISLMRLVLETGRFHGDLHPANIVLVDDDAVPVLLDFGIAGQLDENSRNNLKRLLVSLAFMRDTRETAAALQGLGVIRADVDIDMLVPRLDRIISTADGAIGNISAREIGSELKRLAQATNTKIPRDVALMAKQVIYLEGYNRRLVPEWDPGRDKLFQRFVAGVAADVLRRRAADTRDA